MKAINILLMRKSTAAFSPVTNTYNSGTGATETIPTNASQVVIEEWGPGGGGAGGDSGGGQVGPGGASGAYVKKTIALTSADWGKTFTYTVGPSVAGGAALTNGSTGVATTCVNGTYGTAVNLSAGPGAGGQSGVGRGSGGTATGGDTNTNGNGGGGILRPGLGAPNGGGDSATAAGTAPGGGGAGGSVAGSVGQASAAGRVKFAYT